MNELDVIEANDATLRFAEGGGPVPVGMHAHFASQGQLAGLGQTGSSGAWYKSPTFLTIAGLGIAAIVLTVYMAKKDKGPEDAEEF